MCISNSENYVLTIPPNFAPADTDGMEESWRDRARSRMRLIGETQNTLSEKLEMTQGGLQHWLAGTRQPALEDINRIAALLRCSAAWLTHGLDQTEQLDGITEPARTVLRDLIAAERSGPLPPAFWTGVHSLALSVKAAQGAESHSTGLTPTVQRVVAARLTTETKDITPQGTHTDAGSHD